MHLTSWVSCVSEALLSAVVMVPILILTFALLSPLGLRLRARPPVRDLLVIAMYAQTAPLGLNGLLEGPWHHLVYAIERARGRSSELDAAGAPTLPPPTLPPPTLYLVPAHLAPAAPMLACTLLHARPALALSRSPSRARPHPTPTPLSPRQTRDGRGAASSPWRSPTRSTLPSTSASPSPRSSTPRAPSATLGRPPRP